MIKYNADLVEIGLHNSLRNYAFSNVGSSPTVSTKKWPLGEIGDTQQI